MRFALAFIFSLFPLATPITGLYMANNTQVYPEDRGQNYSVRIGREVARLAAGQK